MYSGQRHRASSSDASLWPCILYSRGHCQHVRNRSSCAIHIFHKEYATFTCVSIWLHIPSNAQTMPPFQCNHHNRFRCPAIPKAGTSYCRGTAVSICVQWIYEKMGLLMNITVSLHILGYTLQQRIPALYVKEFS